MLLHATTNYIANLIHKRMEAPVSVSPTVGTDNVAASACIPPTRNKRIFANEEERRLARNAYLREYRARKKVASETGIDMRPKREKLPISVSQTENRAAYWREYEKIRSDHIIASRRQRYAQNHHSEPIPS